MADESDTQNLDEKQTVKPSADAMDSSSESETQVEQDENANTSLNDFVSQQLKEKGTEVKDEKVEEGHVEPEDKEEEAKPEAESEESVSETEKDKTETEEVEEKEEAEQTEEKEEKKDEETEGPVPRERFKEVTDKVQVLTAQAEGMKTEVEDYRKIIGFMQQNGIDRELFTKTMYFLADFQAGNIEKIAPQIKEWATAVDMVEGNKLPADLQKAVDDGAMTIEVAQRIAKAEAKANMVEKRSRKTVEQMREESFNKAKAEFDRTAEEWERAKRTSDPDYKPKAKESDDDGKWEDVRDKYLAMVNAKDAQGNFINVINTPKDMVALWDRAYAMVEAKLKRYRGVKAEVKRPLDPKRSSSGNNGKKDFTKAPTLGEAIRVGMNQRGYTLK